MKIQREVPMPSRPCQYCLCLQDGAVFADFNTSAEGGLYLVRISFDGYGCCYPDPAHDVSRMSLRQSRHLIDGIVRDALDTPVVIAILSGYFDENRAVLWSDALERHGLV
ncbi:MAG: hypothetical protein ABN482_03620 [Corticimicrobacter sp.]|uniref:hypothetical protein n=1 Tax=Corticimicrobacter sp. TaxID=2678536 RepID=UPI0032DAF285